MHFSPQPVIGPDGKMYTVLTVMEGGLSVTLQLGDHEGVEKVRVGLNNALSQIGDLARRFDLGLLTPAELAAMTGQQPVSPENAGAARLDLSQIAEDLKR